MLTSWREDPAEQRPFAWLSLDDRDNDPVTFWSYVLAFYLRQIFRKLDIGSRVELARIVIQQGAIR